MNSPQIRAYVFFYAPGFRLPEPSLSNSKMLLLPFVCRLFKKVAALVVIIYVVITVVAGTSSLKEGQYLRDDDFADVLPMEPTMQVSARSGLQCGMTCLSMADLCGSFVFHAATGSCMGLATRTPWLTEMTTAPGYRLFRRVPACPTEQGYVYHAPLQLCLQFHSHSTWNCYGAVDYCAGRGDQLAILRDPQMVYFVKDLLDSAADGSVYIIGAKRESGWTWVDGSPVEAAILNMASTSYDCLVVTRNGLLSMWTTNHRYVLCRRDVTGF